MMDALAEGRTCVWDLAELVGADRSTVSKRLAMLKHARSLEDREEGSTTCYSLKMRCLQGF